jgi:hypothetical protein
MGNGKRQDNSSGGDSSSSKRTYSVTEALAEMRLREVRGLEHQDLPLSVTECKAWINRILENIKVARAGLSRISVLCDDLIRNATAWSSLVFDRVLLQHDPTAPRPTLAGDALMAIIDPAMRCVELAVASDSAIIEFFEVYLQDLDDTMEQFGKEAESTTVYRHTMQIADDMAVTAANYTSVLANVASFNRHVLQDMESLVGSYMESDEIVEAQDIVKEELHDMRARIGVGLMMVAEMAWKWDTMKKTRWNSHQL